MIDSGPCKKLSKFYDSDVLIIGLNTSQIFVGGISSFLIKMFCVGRACVLRIKKILYASISIIRLLL